MPTRSRRPAPNQFLLPWHAPKEQCTHKKYYVTCVGYDAMRWRAGDRCEICGVRAEQVQKRPLYIDHDGRLENGFDHVRGLLCARCNTRLRWSDNGYKRPNRWEQHYLDFAWFWTWLPPERLELPFLPPPTDDLNSFAHRRLPKSLRQELAEDNFRLRAQRLRGMPMRRVDCPPRCSLLAGLKTVA